MKIAPLLYLFTMSLIERVVELGKGRFATVECWRLTDGALVAIKAFNHGNIEARERELQSLKSVHTATGYVASIANQSIEMNNNIQCIVMEAYLGGSLNKHIQQCRGSGLHITVIQSYLCELMSALSHLENVGCIHRDIKSSNCVLDHLGHLKLCDFGSAKVFKPNPTIPSSRPSTATKADREVVSTQRTYTITGTSVIMGPEMAAASIGYDYSVDSWAVGVLLYELLTSRLPAWDRSSSAGDAEPKESSAWPTDVNAEIARNAIAYDESVNAPHASEHSDVKVSTRPSSATNLSSASGSNHTSNSHASVDSTVLRSWFLHSVDPTFGDTASTVTASAQNDLNAILGNFSFTPKKSQDQILHERAYELVRILLTVSPTRRFARLLSSLNRLATSSTPRSTASWSAAIRMHLFFADVDWERVDAGHTPPPNVDFDRRLGCLELLREFDTGNEEEELTAAQQALFEGF
jgi:serine/threonine protein kinase